MQEPVTSAGSGESARNDGASPAETLMAMVHGNLVCQMIATAARLSLFDRVAPGGVSAAEVARVAGTLESPTYRLLRGLSAVGIVHEASDRTFSLAPMGQLLRTDVPGSFAPLAVLVGMPCIAAAYPDLEHSLRTEESAFRKRNRVGFFEWFADRKEDEAIFGRAMSTFSAMEVECVLGAYDFRDAAHVVDVGGGHGLLLSRILQAAPAARGTLFDAPAVVAVAREAFEQAGVAQRCERAGGDFFDSVPSGADLYLLKHILHDWDDARALRILESVARAMKSGARLLVIEQGIGPLEARGPGRIMDVNMLALLEGGRERTEQEHAALMTRAGLRWVRTIATAGPIQLFVAERP